MALELRNEFRMAAHRFSMSAISQRFNTVPLVPSETCRRASGCLGLWHVSEVIAMPGYAPEAAAGQNCAF
jgi:hypothetical protein